jgi:hypothetical protein
MKSITAITSFVYHCTQTQRVTVVWIGFDLRQTTKITTSPYQKIQIICVCETQINHAF